MNKKGVAIILVLGTLFVAFVLAAVIVNIISSQGRLTHHQFSRIQAYYAGLAGMNLAVEKLRTGAWTVPAADTTEIHKICKTSTCAGYDAAKDVIDADIPYTVTITLHPLNEAPDAAVINGTAGISIFVDYTYTP